LIGEGAAAGWDALGAEFDEMAGVAVVVVGDPDISGGVDGEGAGSVGVGVIADGEGEVVGLRAEGGLEGGIAETQAVEGGDV
jgi:hypothetical protein